MSSFSNSRFASDFLKKIIIERAINVNLMIYENNLQDNYKELDLFRKLPTKNEVVVDYIRDALNYITGPAINICIKL